MVVKIVANRLTCTIPEFAELTGISKNLAYSLAKEDRLPVPVIHLGKRLVLSRTAVLALLQGNGTPDYGAKGRLEQ